MIRPQYVELKEFPGWWLSSSGIVTKEPAGFCSRCTEPGIEELTEFAGASIANQVMNEREAVNA
jgi:hypothetical protein